MITEAEMETRFNLSARAGMAILFSNQIQSEKIRRPWWGGGKAYFIPAQNF